jgi:choline dehydrogenase
MLAASAINSPKLLMLSGIGLAEHLRETGADVLVDAPGVRLDLDDHVERLVMWEAARPMVTRSTQW